VLLVGYWPREKLLLHAQHLAQQKCRGLQAGQDCGLLHPSLVHLFVGIVLITIFGLFYFFYFFTFWPPAPLFSPSVRGHRLDHYLWSFFFLFLPFGLLHPSLSSSVRGPRLDHYLWSFLFFFFWPLSPLFEFICTCACS